ncbi:aspartate carbamoyltransferase [Aeropyrum pernix]|uniref:Aspartate carbamoyltransferase n=1 Tax=Aeropyrum pernix TaxID=56636 RepID=A0A401H9Z9_AERPX|nr:aspartate carbamoyltransferase [Aeropyrum pernix]
MASRVAGNPFKGRDVISITDFTRGDLELLFREADVIESKAGSKPLDGMVVALAFFEPSTRTRLSFETAVKRLGGSTLLISGEEAISVAKGENLADTITMLDSYADAIVIRHRYEGAALYAAEVAEKPVINGGDGRQHHPTQAMLDLYTVYSLFGAVDGLTYGVLGDLRYGRAASSFILGLSLFNPRHVYLISPPQLRARREVLEALEKRGVPYTEVERLQDVLGELDVLYVTRIQKERIPDPREYESLRGSYRVTLDLLESYAKESLKVLHPLPRVDEIDFSVDNSRYQAYFTQARLGVRVRMALMNLVMKG